MEYSITNFKEVRDLQTLRFDAEYFRPIYLNILSVIKRKADLFTTLEKLGLICDASAFYASLEPYYNQGDIPFIRVSDVERGIVYERSIKISKKILNEFKTLKEGAVGDLVITKGGSIARVGLVTQKSALSRDLIFLNSSILREFEYKFLFIYSATSTYKDLLIRSSSMTAQPHLTTTLVRDIPIYNPNDSFKRKIASLYDLSEKFLLSSQELYIEAENILLSRAKLKEKTLDSHNSFTKKFLEIKRKNRIDAEYFQPKYSKILKTITSGDYAILKENFDLIGSKVFSYYENAEVKVIKTKQLSHRFVDTETDSTISIKKLEDEKLPIVEDNDILFASMGVGSLGKTNLLYKFEMLKEKFTIDSTLKIFRSKLNGKILPEVLTVFLSSKPGQELIYQNVVGSSGIISIYEDYLKNLPIPVLKNSDQLKIQNQVQEAHKKILYSKNILDSAIKCVEISIESSEKEAMNWLNKTITFLDKK